MYHENFTYTRPLPAAGLEALAGKLATAAGLEALAGKLATAAGLEALAG
jgi:hypothetical protein